jgi:nitroreductase
MDTIDAIRTRRMIPKVTDAPPSREEVSELLELAVRAPNHHMTEPWRFHVLAGDAKDSLAQAIAEEQAESKGQDLEEALADARRKVGRAPVIIVCTCIPDEREEVVEQEEIVATAMAIQNLLLAAHAKGLGAYLRTGAVAYHPQTGRHLGLGPNERIVGFVYLGHPSADRKPTDRTPASEKTSWVGWD